MTHLFPSVEALILDIEAQASKHYNESLHFAKSKGMAHKLIHRGDSARAAALRGVAAQMRATFIGTDIKTAVALTDLGKDSE